MDSNISLANDRIGAPVVQSAAQSVLRALRRGILLGDLPAGSQLKQNAIADEFRVSVAPVREALQGLVASGLALSLPNRGVSVSPMSKRDFLDITELRLLLEPHAMRLSAPNLTEKDLDQAENLLQRAVDSTDPVACADLHWAFHLTLYVKADRPRLLTQLEQLYDSIARYLCPVWAQSGVNADCVEIHMEIVNALRAQRFAEAAGLVETQINQTLDWWQREAATVISGET